MYEQPAGSIFTQLRISKETMERGGTITRIN